MHRAGSLLSLALLLLPPAPSAADWPPEGVPVSPVGAGDLKGLASDGLGGAFFLWSAATAEDRWLAVQRIDAEGNCVAGWPPQGVEFRAGERTPVASSFTSLGSFGVSLAYQIVGPQPSNWLSIFHIWPDGVADDQNEAPVRSSFVHSGDGAALGASLGWVPTDPYNGYVYGGYGSRSYTMERWANVPVCDPAFVYTGRSLSVAPDGLGGSFVAWTDVRGSPAQSYVQHLTASGQIAPGWPADGIAIAPVAADQLAPVLCADHVGGFVAVWRDLRESGAARLYAIRRGADGAISQGWPATGFRVSTVGPATQDDHRVLSDHAGGAYVGWRFSRLTHVLGTGSVPASWGSGLTFGTQTPDYFAPDLSGGVFVCSLSGAELRVRHLDSFGADVSGWPASGKLVATGTVALPRVVSDGHHAIVGWSQMDDSTSDVTIFAQRVDDDATVSTQVSALGWEIVPGGIRVKWRVSDSSLGRLTIEREDGTTWRRLEEVLSDGLDNLTGIDRDASPGGHYTYRLLSEGVEIGDRIRVEIPRPALSLAPRPSPATGPFTVQWTIPSPGAVLVEVLDVQGRIMARKLEVATGLRGESRFESTGAWPAGVYVIRLVHGGAARWSRIVLFR